MIYEAQSERVAIRGCCFKLNHLKDICRILLDYIDRAKNAEIERVNKLDSLDDASRKRIIGIIQKNLKLTILFNANRDNERGYVHLDDVDEILDLSNLPNKIYSIVISSPTEIPIRTATYFVENYFSVLLDFSRPKLFEISVATTGVTPNSSNFLVRGTDEAWVSQLHKKLTEQFQKHHTNRVFLHEHNAYDVALLLFGMPLAIYALDRYWTVIEKLLSDESSIIKFAVAAYCFIVSLLLFRMFFGYVRWAWPLIELDEKGYNTRTHRVAWGTLALGISASVFVSLLV